MAAHHRDQYLVRQRQKRGIEIPEDHARAFIQVSHQLEQHRIFVRAQPFALRQRQKLRIDLLSPSLRPADHEVPLELGLIVARTGDRNASPAEESMAVCVIPRAHIRVGERNHVSVQRGHDPANRPDESRALRSRPDHGPRPGNLTYRLRQYLPQNFRRSPAAHQLPCDHIFALRGIHDRQLRNRQALLVRKTHGGARRLSRNIECHCLRRTADLARHIFLF